MTCFQTKAALFGIISSSNLSEGVGWYFGFAVADKLRLWYGER
jgi:hypothetical protein